MANWIVENRITGEVAYAYGADQPDHFGTFPLEQFNHIRQKEVEAAPKSSIPTRQTSQSNDREWSSQRTTKLSEWTQ